MSIRSHRSKGATLIESLFGIFLVAACAAVMAASLPIATGSRTQAEMMNKAIQIAEKEMEQIKRIGYVNLTATSLFNRGLIDSPAPDEQGRFIFTNVDSELVDSPAQLLPQGQGFVTLSDVDLDLRQVTVEVRWVERTRHRTYRISTLVGNF